MIYNGARITRTFHLAAKVSVTVCDARNCIFDVIDFQPHDAGFFSCTRSNVDKYWSVTILGE